MPCKNPECASCARVRALDTPREGTIPVEDLVFEHHYGYRPDLKRYYYSGLATPLRLTNTPPKADLRKEQ